jgi:beta-galactosidase
MEKSLKMNKLTLGVCYYPEHWPQSLWEDDLVRMRDLGVEYVRVAEFAWNKFEPEEGVFTFGFFDGFLDLAHRLGMKVIFCTPTATPPAWLTHKYPEALNATPDGTLYRHGLRRHYTYNSPVYNRLCARLVEKIAEHYCPFPAVSGWQIDNELNCEADVFYSESDHAAFRSHLKEKFLTLDALNEAMGTVFWNQTYTSWDEIYLTRPTVHHGTNPHMALEEKRFISRSAIAFCKLQADIIRKHAPAGQFITTNGIFGHLDSHEMTDAALDFIMYDSYPDFAHDLDDGARAQGSLKDRAWARNLSRARSISPNFGIMEQQSGPGGWDIRMRQPMPKPGQMRLWTFQSVAHGADYIGYFRWRTCWVGTEIYWHGLNDYSNQPNRRLAELETIRGNFVKLAPIAGSRYRANVAFVKDYDNEWDGEQDRWHGPLDKLSEDGWLAASQHTHTPMDYLYLRRGGSNGTTLAGLQKYGLLVYPHATILPKETAELLGEYVRLGGQLVMGARTGYKDEYGRCPMMPMPGYASELCGVRVADYTFLGPDDAPETAVWNGKALDAPMFNDVLEATGGARVLARFRGNYYDGAPALVANRIGEGTAYYLGAGFSEEMAENFLNNLGFASPFAGLVELPREAELAVRSAQGRDYLFILNYEPHVIEIDVKRPMTDLLTGRAVSGKVEMEKYGVMVLRHTPSAPFGGTSLIHRSASLR